MCKWCKCYVFIDRAISPTVFSQSFVSKNRQVKHSDSDGHWRVGMLRADFVQIGGNTFSPTLVVVLCQASLPVKVIIENSSK